MVHTAAREEMDGVRPGASVIVPADRVKVGHEVVSVGAPRVGERRGEPKIQLIREDGMIRAIDVHCPCGECIRIRCEYS
jgi:hypothetical protein